MAVNEVNGIDVTKHMGLVHAIAHRYKWATGGSGVGYDDLVQSGLEGAMVAASKFDHSRGLKFSTYASWWIRHYIAREIHDRGRTIRIPVGLQDKLRRAGKPLPCPCTSVDAPAKDDDPTSSMHDFLASPDAAPDKPIAVKERETLARRLIDTLDARHRLVIRKVCLEGALLRDVAKTLGVSRERVRQLKNEALESMARAGERTGAA
jgi:RNA polymerase sigma factor (sigma-70 family)